MIWLFWLAIIAGLALLVWSADRFVVGASALAHNLGVSAIVIGMVIMGFGTSAPEMFVAAIASYGGNPSIAVGNALGSNIANVALVLGASALIRPLTVASKTLRREFPVLFLITGFTLLLMLDHELSRAEGMLLLLGCAAMVVWLLWLAKSSSHKGDPLEAEFEAEVPANIPNKIALFWIFLGLILLIASSQLLVWGAVNIAKIFGVSDLVIGLTIVAIGTSLPEVAVSITGAIKGEDDIAIGNVIGSNMFNLLAVMGVGVSIAPTPLSNEVLSRDFLVMSALTVALFVMSVGYNAKPGRINRFEAFLLLLAYAAYLLWLYVSEI